MAENLQAPGDTDAEEEGDDEHDEDSFHDAHDGGHDPEPDDDDPGDSPSKRSRRGPGPDPPDGDDPDGGDDPEYTDVKISRREADKVVVPPFPTVTHLESWMSQCIANVLSACADPNQEEWMKWLSPALRPHPDIEALRTIPDIRSSRASTSNSGSPCQQCYVQVVIKQPNSTLR